MSELRAAAALLGREPQPLRLQVPGNVAITTLTCWQSADGYHLSLQVFTSVILQADYVDGKWVAAVRADGWASQATKNRLNAVLAGLGIKHRIAYKDKLLWLQRDGLDYCLATTPFITV